jgi:rhamnopyranosyl-N-acetylglucosaminyl-diphospho-decaprenol beta-1,3/1,4-galactofuranosyltransferase
MIRQAKIVYHMKHSRIQSNFFPSVVAIVVTHNRMALLLKCVAALRRQRASSLVIVVVNNASTDGTGAWLTEQTEHEGEQLYRVDLPQNRGGAGGFKAGIEEALKTDCQWFWIMDDDAEPGIDALQFMLRHCTDNTRVLGSLAAHDHGSGFEICWPPISQDGSILCFSSDLPGPIFEVGSLPFLGFLIHRDLVEQVGLPDESFFLSCDDLEYCERLKRVGARLFLVRDSIISHPVPDRRIVRLFTLTFILIRQAAWKNYYNARNRIILARRYHGAKLWTATLPSVLLRMIFALLYGPEPLRQFRAFTLGILHGLLGRAGQKATF